MKMKNESLESRVESLSETEKKMKKPIPKIRVFGQRSIASSFLNRSSVPVEASSVKPKNSDEWVRRPFTSFDSSKDLTELSHGFGVERKAREEKKKDDGGLEKMMLQQFKPREIQISEEVNREVTVEEASLDPVDQIAAEETDDMDSYIDGNNEDIIIVKDDKTSKKRKDPFEGMESMSRTGKSVIVFGDNSKVSKPVQRGRGSNNNSKKQRSTYNHYANGSGWWDCDMEGVDSEEVGHSEVWEGVGSTTFGDIVDWH